MTQHESPTRPRRWVFARWLSAIRRLGIGIVVGLGALTMPFTGAARIPIAASISVPTTSAEALPGEPVLSPDGVYVPPTLDPTRPAPILLALHGYAGSGSGIAARLRSCADQYGWMLLAPTMAYGDYFDPQQLRSDAQQNLPRVHQMIDELRAGVRGVDLQPGLLVYGFSRGAQMAERFSIVYPDEVAGVATLSAGSYTLPQAQDSTHRPMDFPFGIADLSDIGLQGFNRDRFSQIPFWVGVGSNDTNPADTSRAWDAYEGTTRVQRARTLVGDLHDLGVSAQLHIFGGAGHEETGAMRTAACAFLDSVSASSTG